MPVTCVAGNRPPPSRRESPLRQRMRVIVNIRRQLESTKFGLLNVRSVNNKFTLIEDCIRSNDFDFFAITETWHDSASCPNVIACAPPGYRCIEEARVRTGKAATSTLVNHGGVCIVYRTRYTVRRIDAPHCKTAEVLAVHAQGAGINVIIVVVYRSESHRANSKFLEEFGAVMECVAAKSASVLVVGDTNVYLDVPTDTNCIAFNDILSGCGFVQHVKGPTHRDGHTLDVVITPSTMDVMVQVDPPIYSDHSLITAKLYLDHRQHVEDTVTLNRRNWSTVDFAAFEKDLRQSELFINPPASCDEYFDCYDNSLRTLVDKFAPLQTKIKKIRRQSPWFNYECGQIKNETRRLERKFRSTRTVTDHANWRRQFDNQRTVFQNVYTNYWAAVIKKCPDSRALWSRLKGLLEPSVAPVETHTASDFAEFFTSKINTIRASTVNAPAPTIIERVVPPMDRFQDVTVDEVAASIKSAP